MSERETVVRSVEFYLETSIPRDTQVELVANKAQGKLECEEMPAESAGFLPKSPLRYVFALHEPGPRSHRILTVKINHSRFYNGLRSLDQDAQCRLRIGVIDFFNPQNTLDKDVLIID